MSIWLVIAVLAVGSIALKATGPLLAGGRQPPASATRVIALLAPALLTSLVVVGTTTSGQLLTLDGRLAGVAAGTLALWYRAPVVVALLIAATTTALLRMAG
jgi:hypothetical protein